MGYRSVVDHQQLAGIQRYDQLIDLESRIRLGYESKPTGTLVKPK
jgi:hypothetical protein